MRSPPVHARRVNLSLLTRDTFPCAVMNSHRCRAYSNPPTQPGGFFLRWATLPL